MHPFYDSTSYNDGELVFAIENDAPPVPDNPTGKSIPAWNEEFHRIGTIPPETALVVIRQSRVIEAEGWRQGMYLSVLSPQFGKVWIQCKDVVRLFDKR